MHKPHPDVDEVRRLLRETPLTVAKIAEDTGVSRRWITYLQSDQYDRDPGANRIWTLLTYLRETQAA